MQAHCMSSKVPLYYVQPVQELFQEHLEHKELQAIADIQAVSVANLERLDHKGPAVTQDIQAVSQVNLEHKEVQD
jgi:hypothetical protein